MPTPSPRTPEAKVASGISSLGITVPTAGAMTSPAEHLITALVGAATVGAGAGAAFLGSSSCQITFVITNARPPEMARTIV